MAIARDSNLATFDDAAGTTHTYSFNNSAGNFLLVPVFEVDGGDFVTGVTYNGVAMTNGGKIALGTTQIYIFYLASPATGTHNIVISANNAACDTRGGASSYSGVTGGFGNSTTLNNTTASPFTTTLTTPSDNCWTVLAVGGTNAVTASTGSNFRSSDSGSDGRFTCFYDSSGAITPAGSHSMSVTHSGTVANSSVMLSMTPTTLPSGPANMKTWNGVAKASVKTIDAVAIGSIKTAIGVS